MTIEGLEKTKPMTSVPEGLFEAVVEEASKSDGREIDLDCRDLNELLGDFDEGTHPYDGYTWSYELMTVCIYGQTLEQPAEYETFGRVWIMDSERRLVKEWKAENLW